MRHDPDSKHTDSKLFFEEDISVHIFTVSAAMVGVCMTVIGLIRVMITIKKVDALADDLLGIDAVLFLASCLLSYWAMRTRKYFRMHRIERAADGVFILALILMVAICLFVVYAIDIL